MASNPITSWQTEGEDVEAVTDFISLASKISEDGDCSHEINFIYIHIIFLSYIFICIYIFFMGLLRLYIGKESVCQCRRCNSHGFNPRFGMIPWKRAWQPTPVFLTGESPQSEEPGRLQSRGL